MKKLGLLELNFCPKKSSSKSNRFQSVTLNYFLVTRWALPLSQQEQNKQTIKVTGLPVSPILWRAQPEMETICLDIQINSQPAYQTTSSPGGHTILFPKGVCDDADETVVLILRVACFGPSPSSSFADASKWCANVCLMASRGSCVWNSPSTRIVISKQLMKMRGYWFFPVVVLSGEFQQVLYQRVIT